MVRTTVVGRKEGIGINFYKDKRCARRVRDMELVEKGRKMGIKGDLEEPSVCCGRLDKGFECRKEVWRETEGDMEKGRNVEEK